MTQNHSPVPEHGGNLSEASARFGRPVEDWLDLSTGINPRAYADTAVSREAWEHLPSPGALEDLVSAARAAYGIPTDAALCAAAGTQAILQALPAVVDHTAIAVVSPTYGEHAHIWRQAQRVVTEIGDVDQVVDAEVVVIVNPNNPDGRQTEPVILEALRSRLAATGGLVILDEAFADVAPDISMASRAGQQGILVLRSFGKYFGLAGLRLGFAAGTDDLISPLRDRLGPWAVSGAAIEIGTRALADEAWIEATRLSLAALRERLDSVLSSTGLSIVGGTDLYRLVYCEDSHALFGKLGEAGVLVREFPDRPGWLRFGLPGNDADFDRLEQALK